MKFLLNALFICFSFASVSVAENQKPLETVPYVDVSRYLGAWYRIAANPLFFEGKCVCSRQVLGLTQEMNVSVYNSCNESVGGPLREIRGTAYNQDSSTNARFTVDFGFPHKGQYWIIGLASDYRWAVVSDPSRLSLYVLSKTPELSPEDYSSALASVVGQIDTSKLVMEVQQGCVYP